PETLYVLRMLVGIAEAGFLPGILVYLTWWFPAYGLLPRWHHAQPVRSEKPAGLETITLSYYRDHIEHRFLARIM
ncbi:hypothetical protein, partial [Serratia marcescens]|uniref:hypothetical protein n=1 Tax=Serratia marcescens TaxID=615 RepID=UPI0013C2BD2B